MKKNGAVIKMIEIIRGDTSLTYKFQRRNESGVIKTKPKKMWITFKEDCCYSDCLFQKTLEDGIEYDEDDNYYRFKFKPEDTRDLKYGVYGFDIAIIDENGEKKTLLNSGELKIVKHYTHKCNEV